MAQWENLHVFEALGLIPEHDVLLHEAHKLTSHNCQLHTKRAFHADVMVWPFLHCQACWLCRRQAGQKKCHPAKKGWFLEVWRTQV